MKFNYLFIICFLSLIVFSACDEETIEVSDALGYEYFPMDEGHTIFYKVDTTFYDEFNDTVFTRSWEVKEEILLLDEDPEGNTRARILKSVRPYNSELEFSAPEINFATRSSNTLDIQDNNLRFIRLTFPILDGINWDGNVYINQLDDDYEDLYRDWNYTYSNVNDPVSIGSLNFNEAIHIAQVADDPANILSYRFAEEKYAKGIGLIYRKLDNLILKTGNTAAYEGIEWPERANNGYSTTWEIIDYQTVDSVED